MQAVDPIFHLHHNFESLLERIGRHLSPRKTESCAAYLQVLTGLPHPFANLVILRDQELSGFAKRLKHLEDFSRTTGAPVAILAFPGEHQEDFVLRTLDRQWTPMGSMPGMWMELNGLPEPEVAPEGIEVRLASSPQDLRLVCKVLEEGYPVPPDVADFFMRGIHEVGEGASGRLGNLIITVDGEAAACSSVCVEDGVAGVYCVATVERFRRKGFGAMVTMAALRQAVSLGAHSALLHASEMGDSVYRHMGFKEMCRIHVLGFGV